MSSLDLTKAYWKKKAPGGLEKPCALFGKTAETFSKLREAIHDGADAAASKRLDAAIAGLQSAARQLVAEAEQLRKKGADKAALRALDTTIAMLGKPLSAEIAAARAELEAATDKAGAEKDEDDGGDRFSDPVAHGAFLNKVMPRLRRMTANFAIGMGSKRAEDLRLNFHPKKSGKGLASPIRKAMPIEKFTFGTCGTEDFARAHGVENPKPRTLYLKIEGRRIPGLAKKLRKMLKSAGVVVFPKVAIIDGDGVDEGEETPAVPGTAPQAGQEAAAGTARAAAPEAPAPPADTAADPAEIARLERLWDRTLKDVRAQIGQIRAALMKINDPAHIAVRDGLFGVMDRFPDLDLSKLRLVAGQQDRARYDEVLKASAREIAESRGLLERGPLLADIDRNPFVRTSVHRTVTGALDEIQKSLKI